MDGLFNIIFGVSIHALLAECDGCGLPSDRQETRFNPRTPCGVRLSPFDGFVITLKFQSTHSLRSATFGKSYSEPEEKFQSTHSLRSATINPISSTYNMTVSIHALLAECDQIQIDKLSFSNGFQSTHSLRSATNAKSEAIEVNLVSIHALLAECDLEIRLLTCFPTKFQSTHSLRSATYRGLRAYQ